MTVEDITHTDDLSSYLTEFNKILSAEVDGYTMDKRCVRKDGKVIHVGISAESIGNKDGKVEYLVAFMKGITPRMESEKIFRASKASATCCHAEFLRSRSCY